MVELPAAVIMITEAADPRLAGEGPVHALPNPGEALVGQASGTRSAAILLNSRPVEVVTDVQHVLRVAGASPLLHHVGDKSLGAVVNAVDIAAILRALVAQAALVGRGVVAGHRGTPIADAEHVGDADLVRGHSDVTLVQEAVVLRGHQGHSEAPGSGGGVVAQAWRQQTPRFLGLGLGGIRLRLQARGLFQRRLDHLLCDCRFRGRTRRNMYT
mmetsp:Transcript_70876/g.205467  ORF Transcript_70876/g.205467 Transcript_70876/m.205467 type:complete len:214 (-) Transcript_70876:169-810(-)